MSAAHSTRDFGGLLGGTTSSSDVLLVLRTGAAELNVESAKSNPNVSRLSGLHRTYLTFGYRGKVHYLPRYATVRRLDPYFRLLFIGSTDFQAIGACPQTRLTFAREQVEVVPLATLKHDTDWQRKPLLTLTCAMDILSPRLTRGLGRLLDLPDLRFLHVTGLHPGGDMLPPSHTFDCSEVTLSQKLDHL
jgi:hypothetical protein